MNTMTATKHAPIAGDCVWNGKDIEKSNRWIRDLTPAHLAELDKALQGVKAKGLDWSEVTKENFPLKGFDDLFDSIREELENGSGILKLRGWPVTKYDEADLRIMYNGFAKHIATPVFQNRSGEMMRAIRDEGAHVGKTYGETKDQKGGTFLSSYARTLSSGELRFHTDRTDVVGLLCVRQARKGGVSKLASSPAIHNAMLAARPDLVDELYQDIWRSRFGEEGTTKETAYPLPIFGVRDGKFTSHYSQTFVDAAQLGTRACRSSRPSRTRPSRCAAQARPGSLHGDGARSGRSAADKQPRHLSRPHLVRGQCRHRQRPAAAAPVALHAEQPPAARRPRDPVAGHRGRPHPRRHPAGHALRRGRFQRLSRF